ncbi:nuclear transport factor 2 family protein [Nocardia sp. NPDC057668]|uniref:nuclear transport factor 2 family protein n=1 Tax=Nocardia sp. NPDC057668 TaxID=3346202 RepID=UPI00366F17FD
MSEDHIAPAAIAALIERESIRELKARYCRFLDGKDEESWRSVFTLDVRVRTDIGAATGSAPARSFTLEGVDAFVPAVLATLAGVTTVHHCHTSEITLTSATTAGGIWAMADRLIYSDGRELHGAGHYHETYEKSGGTWRISSLHLTRLHVKLIGDWTNAPA